MVCKFEETIRLLGQCPLNRWDQSRGVCRAPCGESQFISTNTSYQLSSMAVKEWWFGLVLQLQHLGTLESLSWPWTPIYNIYKLIAFYNFGAICPKAKIEIKLGSETRQCFQESTIKWLSVAVAQSKSRRQSNWNAAMGPKESCAWTNTRKPQ